MKQIEGERRSGITDCSLKNSVIVVIKLQLGTDKLATLNQRQKLEKAFFFPRNFLVLICEYLNVTLC
jgi:hypothetical protein